MENLEDKAERDTDLKKEAIDIFIEVISENNVFGKFMSISEISEAVGFCDVYYFSTMFKKIIGVSPVKVRK